MEEWHICKDKSVIRNTDRPEGDEGRLLEEKTGRAHPFTTYLERALVSHLLSEVCIQIGARYMTCLRCVSCLNTSFEMKFAAFKPTLRRSMCQVLNKHIMRNKVGANYLPWVVDEEL